ncbi:hypothetical protein BO70DRAFT_184632 [Aspergillus heteromorphus CBS 117.55]|uniref:Uncharacterized protein n=1 Tax=Aspergillus heteromorphus CBS 117.55 TaxID=1448321 RepID=A0A317WQ52_9EURO|nr:uncharacterized protein BO70DRAFT_184632 [Aspergillus heteromorphus CBS 117.55]PWY88553.1 hypothetical protein BO70DRAFT_184632 [Aspergillus heteromorphus CBS 117.55]
MSTQNMNKKSWESLSSTFSQLEISISQDSCYASDEVSVTSNGQPAPKPAPNSSGVLPVQPATGPSLRPLLKPILKRPYSEIEDEESESGYASEDSDFEYDAIFGESDDDDDDMYHVSGWDDASDIMYETYDEEDDESCDGDFVSFGGFVRFDDNVRYIDAPDVDDAEDEEPQREMTCHELMEIARASGTLHIQEGESDDSDVDDIEDDEHSSILESMEQLPEEHPSDSVELDRRIFVAYMNAINGISDLRYKAQLRSQVNDFETGRVHSPYLDSGDATGAYFDTLLNHVIGLFRNVVAKEELSDLVSLSNQVPGCFSDASHPETRVRIEAILREKLACDTINIGPDELSFFASGVVYALEKWQGFLH